MKWRLYKRLVKDDRAPSRIKLENYETMCVADGYSREEVIRLWITDPEELSSELNDGSTPSIGYLLENCDEDKFLILTPQGLWAEVEVVH